MESLFFYLLNGILRQGNVVKCEMQVADEDAWHIISEYDGHYVNSWTLQRSEIRLIRDCYEKHKLYMLDSERAHIEKLIAVL